MNWEQEKEFMLIWNWPRGRVDFLAIRNIWLFINMYVLCAFPLDKHKIWRFLLSLFLSFCYFPGWCRISFHPSLLPSLFRQKIPLLKLLVLMFDCFLCQFIPYQKAVAIRRHPVLRVFWENFTDLWSYSSMTFFWNNFWLWNINWSWYFKLFCQNIEKKIRIPKEKILWSWWWDKVHIKS